MENIYSLYTNTKVDTYKIRFDMYVCNVQSPIFDVIPLLKILIDKAELSSPKVAFNLYPVLLEFCKDIPFVRNIITPKLAGDCFIDIMKLMMGVKINTRTYEFLSSCKGIDDNIKTETKLKASIIPYLCLMLSPDSLMEISNIFNESDTITYFLIDVLLVDKSRLLTQHMKFVSLSDCFELNFIPNSIISEKERLHTDYKRLRNMYMQYSNDELLYLKSIGFYHISGVTEMLRLSNEPNSNSMFIGSKHFYNSVLYNYKINLFMENGEHKTFIIHDKLFNDIKNIIFYYKDDDNDISEGYINIEESSIFNETNISNMLFVINNPCCTTHNNILSTDWFLCLTELKFHLILKDIASIRLSAVTMCQKIKIDKTEANMIISNIPTCLSDKSHFNLTKIVDVLILGLGKVIDRPKMFTLFLDITHIILKSEHEYYLQILLNSSRILYEY